VTPVTQATEIIAAAAQPEGPHALTEGALDPGLSGVAASTLLHREPLPGARDGAVTGRRVADYRAAIEELLAAGVSSNEAIAAALNVEPLYTPPETAWDSAAIEHLLRFLRLRSAGRVTAAPGVPYRPAQARPYGAPTARAGRS
jgi:hypothetical protein